MDEGLREASACWHRDHVRIPHVLFVVGMRLALDTCPMSLVLWTSFRVPCRVFSAERVSWSRKMHASERTSMAGAGLSSVGCGLVLCPDVQYTPLILGVKETKGMCMEGRGIQ